ncbi:hypothetical protein [Salinispora arenicola]|uniref:hypothetical protein n=1 Tax=Salinispora arenicola TaxID=168697 RepID=UPI00036A87CA|nr:hypothetical protein [Salinispora arenicola]
MTRIWPCDRRRLSTTPWPTPSTPTTRHATGHSHDPRRHRRPTKALLAWLASRAGIVLDADSGAALTAGVVALAMAGYYALVRVAEARWPWLGVLLGTPAAPKYEQPAVRQR